MNVWPQVQLCTERLSHWPKGYPASQQVSGVSATAAGVPRTLMGIPTPTPYLASE